MDLLDDGFSIIKKKILEHQIGFKVGAGTSWSVAGRIAVHIEFFFFLMISSIFLNNT